MNASKSKNSWNPAWRYIRMAMLLWGIVQMIWLYLRIDRYSVFTSSVFVFLLIGIWALKLQLRNEK